MSIKPFIDGYPKLFRSGEPSVCTTVPTGWNPLLHELCQLILSACTTEETEDFKFEEISVNQGFLLMRYNLPPTLSLHWRQAIDARSFAIGNRSHATCVKCGRKISKFPEIGILPLCDDCLFKKVRLAGVLSS